MFLEVRVTLVDPNKKYLDLRSLSGSFPGGGGFGEWKVVGDHIECSASWVACLAGFYTDLCSEHGLFYRSGSGDVVPFRAVGGVVSDPVTATFYVMLLLKDVPGADAFLKARLNGESGEPFAALFPRADPGTAAILAELEPLWTEMAALPISSMADATAAMFPDADPLVKAIVAEMAHAWDKGETTPTRAELNARLGIELPPPPPVPLASTLAPVFAQLAQEFEKPSPQGPRGPLGPIFARLAQELEKPLPFAALETGNEDPLAPILAAVRAARAAFET
uniref:Uncharacterized protein n=1 Tax=Marseillevirus LCMAC103 TaxID=2506604 RepID=A0A481YUY5_9VIRU|nr:MAG: uncharacterized protein LCMAC103_03260 [Marseillevirus LCMAC103]